MNWQELLHYRLAGNTVSDWSAAVIVLVVTWSGLAVIRWAVSKYLAKASERTATQVDDVVAKVLVRTRWFLYFPVALYAAGKLVTLPGDVEYTVGKVALIGVLIQCGVWSTTAISASVQAWVSAKGEAAAHHATMAAAVRFISELIVWSIICVFVLANLGIEVSALLAGLGVGGVAVALAAQNILGDLFASVSIYLDRPFDIGDSVVIDGVNGTVERVGIRSSRIRAVSGEEVIFPNRRLVETRIQNSRRMRDRRVLFTVGVVYGTSFAMLQRIPEIVREVVEGTGGLRFDRCHFKSYGDYSLIFEIVYFVNTADQEEHLDRQQTVNLEIYRRFEEQGIAFAYPTQTLFVHQVAPPSPVRS